MTDGCILVGPKSPQYMLLGQHKGLVLTPTKMFKLLDLQISERYFRMFKIITT